MNPNISKKVLDKIRKKKIKPTPKWEFLLKNYIFWGALVLAVLIGALATSVVIFKIVNADWDIAKRVGEHPIAFTLKILPYFWLIILALFTFITYYNFKHTKTGYKYRLPLVVGSTILISIVLGFALFGIRVAKVIDEKALDHIPYYKEMTHDKRLEMWKQEEGIMAGEILEIQEQKLKIKNLKGEIWTIYADLIPPKVQEGMKIGAIGEITGDYEFTAEKVRPWQGNFPSPRNR